MLFDSLAGNDMNAIFLAPIIFMPENTVRIRMNYADPDEL